MGFPRREHWSGLSFPYPQQRHQQGTIIFVFEFLAVLGLHSCACSSLVVVSGLYSLVVVASLRAWALGSVGFSSGDMRAQ